MSTETQKVDVLAGFVASHPKHPQSTGGIAGRLRLRRRSQFDSRLVMHKTPTTAAVLRALEMASREGMVQDVGTGEDNRNTWRDLSASAKKERYWVLTDAALARVWGDA